ncbi:MAG: GNAT family N-acetyltransferase [Gammaproteobacteria bacterium]|nr:GNAT family N-acetyltransferase [Gammaproteobacteria bacterium]
MSYRIRDIDPPSIAIIHAINEEALPHVNSVPSAWFSARLHDGSYFRGVYHQGRPAAFLLAMDETADYDSLNFLWFRGRYPRFVYIDRIVVAPGHRRSGLGGLLYDDLLAWARERTPRLACEVNLRPSNEPSLHFHERQGFRPVGTQETDGGRKTVSLMLREVLE